MKKVANRKLIRILSYRTIKEKKGKNLIAVLAIALTTLLFTALFTVGASMLASIEEATMRQVGTSAHGGYKNLSRQEYEKVQAAGGYRAISYDIIAGFAVNPELKEIQTEVRYAEEQMAKWSFCYPEEGRMPEKADECAVSSKVLEALGIPLVIGEKVPLTISSHDKDGKEKLLTQEFTLTGYWYSNEASFAQELWISKEWLLQNVDILDENHQDRMERTGVYAAEGAIQAGIMFDSSFDIDSRMDELTGRAGLPEDKIKESVNWAYATAQVDGMTLILGISLLGIILFSGYLIIYNIFYLNVSGDIRYYGLLKTIGTTGRQLRHLVRQQALFLSAAGLPLGLFLGWFVGKGILPSIFAALDTGGVRRVALNPWIFVGSALFSLLTVYISCIKPCRLAARVSPIEAVRYVENQDFHIRKNQKIRRFSMINLAGANMARNKKKTLLVIASLSLSLMLLNATWCLVKGFSFDKYVKNYLIGDMRISHFSASNFSTNELDYEAITPEIVERLQGIEGVAAVDCVFQRGTGVHLTQDLTEAFSDWVSGLPDMDTWEKEYARKVQEENQIEANAYLLETPLFEQVQIKAGAFEKEEFEKGGTCLVLADPDSESGSWLQPGDVVTLESEEGVEKKLTVTALADMPYSLTSGRTFQFGTELILSEKDFRELYETKGALHGNVFLEEGKEKEAEEEVRAVLTEEYPELIMSTKETLREEFAKNTDMFSMIGGMLALILGIIGVLNLINAMITGILARKQEFAMMQAVGMTGKQLEQMLMLEGAWYGISTLLVTATLGNVVSYGAVYLMGKNMAFFEWHFDLLPFLVSIPVIAFFTALIPVVCYQTLCKKSIIERLRLAEV